MGDLNSYGLLFLVVYFVFIITNREKVFYSNLLISAIIVITYIVSEQVISKISECRQCLNKNENFESINDVNLDDEIAHDFNKEYMDYQENEDLNGSNNIKNSNIFKMAIGNQNIVQPYLQSAKKYYDDIYKRSVNTATSQELMDSEMKYSDLNYIVPLNAGMVNPAMTYVAPQNWYPIQPVPPVCVSANRTTTQPLSVVNNYMPFASLQDFNRARRFTGNMQINVDYIKNVLNDPEAGNP